MPISSPSEAERGRRVIAFFAETGVERRALDDALAVLSQAGFRILELAGAIASIPAVPRQHSIMHGFLHALWQRFVRPILIGPLMLARLAAVDRMIGAAEAHLVILAEDNIAGRSRLVAEAARRRGIPVLILPYTIPNVREAMLTSCVAGWLARLVLRFRPQWGWHDGRQLRIRLPVSAALAMETCGVVPEHPWILNSGPGVIAVESLAMEDLYRRVLGGSQRLVMIGSSADDRLYRAATARLSGRSALGIPAQARLLVWALPPDQWQAGLVPEGSKGDYRTLMGRVARLLGGFASDFEVLARPHPRLPSDLFDAVDGIRLDVSAAGMADILPLADLYLASSSATIRWALACGIPVINFDVFGYLYDDYADAAGVVHVDSIAGLEAELKRLSERRAFEEFTQRAKSDAWRWGVIDNAFAGRLVRLADDLTKVCNE